MSKNNQNLYPGGPIGYLHRQVAHLAGTTVGRVAKATTHFNGRCNRSTCCRSLLLSKFQMFLIEHNEEIYKMVNKTISFNFS